ncbi:MAG: CRISPR-associated endonuclease Cas1 [Rickettsiales bacterium]|jgi:CRISPR-associated protein Cas1|nr:CRISPR-associated endonuclease Cas1 [Rickettsiales bacterium]
MTYIAEKTTLYLNNDYKIKKRSDNLIIYKNDEKIQSVPALKIKDIVIIGNIDFGCDTINFCKEHNIQIHFISRNGKYYGSLNFNPELNIFPRLKQNEKRFNEKESNDFAINFITSKIYNQKWFLETFNQGIIFKIPKFQNISAYQEILGIEGSKSREYFSYWSSLIKNNDFQFIKRTKHPPKDEINAILSLCYTFLSTEIHTLCNLVALDPYIGFLHKEYYGRPSLVCDLMEAYRPFVDKFVITLINRREIRKENFEISENKIEYKLNSDSFGLVMGKWTKFFKEDLFYSRLIKKEITLYKIIEYDIRFFVKYLIGEVESFQQLRMDNSK